MTSRAFDGASQYYSAGDILRQINAAIRRVSEICPHLFGEFFMSPGDQAVVAFVVAVFVIFSIAMAYATFLGSSEKRDGN